MWEVQREWELEEVSVTGSLTLEEKETSSFTFRCYIRTNLSSEFLCISVYVLWLKSHHWLIWGGEVRKRTCFHLLGVWGFMDYIYYLWLSLFGQFGSWSPHQRDALRPRTGSWTLSCSTCMWHISDAWSNAIGQTRLRLLCSLVWAPSAQSWMEDWSSFMCCIQPAAHFSVLVSRMKMERKE